MDRKRATEDIGMNCPFYGHHLIIFTVRPATGVLADTHGNQCALITDAFSPCLREVKGESVDWRECPVVASIQGTPNPAFMGGRNEPGSGPQGVQ